MSDAELARFEAGGRALDGFFHREHVRTGFALLDRYCFTDAAHRFATGLKTMAAKGGQATLYHETITIAFLSLIAEQQANARDFPAFEQANPDLFKDVLARRYSAERLDSPLARQTFLLPDLPCR